MTRESIKSINRNVIFYEPFLSNSDIVRKGGVITDIDLEGGVANLNGISSYITYPLSLSGTYTVRIKLTDNNAGSGRYYLDFRGSGGSGTGYIHISSLNALDLSSGTGYINGQVGSSIDSTTKEVVISGISLSTDDLTYIGRRYNATEYLNGTINLIEIYKGTLTAEEINLLYKNKYYKGLVQDGLKYYFDFPHNLSFYESQSGLTGTNSGVEIRKQGAVFTGSENYDFGSDIDMGTEHTIIVALDNMTDESASFDSILGISNSNLSLYYLNSTNNIAYRIRDSVGGSTENATSFGNNNTGKAVFAISRNGANITQFFGTTKTTTTLSNPTYKFFFDKLGRQSNGSLMGTMYSVAIYDKALSDEECIQSINYFKKRFIL